MLPTPVLHKRNGRRVLLDPRGGARDLLCLVHSHYAERGFPRVLHFAAIVSSETLETLHAQGRLGSDGLREGLSAALLRRHRGVGVDGPHPWGGVRAGWLLDALARLLVEAGPAESGATPRRVVEVNPMVLEALRPVQARLPANVLVRLRLGPTSLRTIASPALAQALGALFAHAGVLLARGDGVQKLSVRTQPVPSLLRGSAAIRIQVTLTAPGLPAALAHAFDPGQPLSGVRHIITAHGGAVSVARRGRAGRIVLELPAA